MPLTREQRKRVSEYRKKRRERLRERILKKLGGKCRSCGGKQRLEVDHIYGRDYEVRKLGSYERMQKYLEEHKEGKVQLLCQRCNALKGYTNTADFRLIREFWRNLLRIAYGLPGILGTGVVGGNVFVGAAGHPTRVGWPLKYPPKLGKLHKHLETAGVYCFGIYWKEVLGRSGAQVKGGPKYIVKMLKVKFCGAGCKVVPWTELVDRYPRKAQKNGCGSGKQRDKISRGKIQTKSRKR